MHTEYTFDATTRAFLTELFRELGHSLRPARRTGAELLHRFLDTHLGVAQADQAVVSRQYSRPHSNQMLVAIEDVLSTNPYRTGRTVDYDDEEGERAPRSRSVPVTSSDSRSVLEEGYYPAYDADTPLVVGVAQRDRQLDVWVNVRRADVILDPVVRDEIERHVLRFADREVAYREAGLPFRRGVILAGPPGVGKTQVFRALTYALRGRYSVVWVTPGTISWQCSVADVFAFARVLRPVLLLWEDLDLTVQDRRTGTATRELGELLAQLDGPQAADGIIACASTNDVATLDKALSARPSRFDRVLHVAPPGAEARLRMLRRFASRIERLRADLAEIAEQTDGLTGADLQELVVGAFTCALDEADDADGATVTTSHFIAALQRLERRQVGPDRWRTVWRSNGR
jgi:AAA+ superfamily predicted ATPase